MKTIFKGNLSFSLVNVPVKVYSAINNDKVKFNQVNSKTGNGISYQKIDKVTKDVVDHSDIVKGYNVDGDFITFDSEEIDSCKVSGKGLIIDKFVKLSQVPQMLLSDPYFIASDGPGFDLLITAIKRSRKAAIGSFALRGSSFPVVIIPSGNILNMYKLRYETDLKQFASDPIGKVDKDQLTLTMDLIKSMSGEFEGFEDKQETNLRALLDSKMAELPETSTTKTVDITKVLKESIKKAS